MNWNGKRGGGRCHWRRKGAGARVAGLQRGRSLRWSRPQSCSSGSVVESKWRSSEQCCGSNGVAKAAKSCQVKRRVFGLEVRNLAKVLVLLRTELWLCVRGVLFGEGTEQEEAKAEAVENLKYLEAQLEGKKFFGGETIGFLDLAVGWIANLLSVLEEITGYILIEELSFPLLWEWMQYFSNVPVIKESWPSREKLVVKFQIMRKMYIAGEI